MNLSPPKYANVRVIFNDLTDEQLENDQLSYESLVRQCKDSRSFKVDLNKSVRNFKVQLRYVYINQHSKFFYLFHHFIILVFTFFFSHLIHHVNHPRCQLSSSSLNNSSLYDVIASNIRVFYIDTEMSELLGILHIEELRFAQKKLYTYNVQDGDEFLIEMK